MTVRLDRPVVEADRLITDELPALHPHLPTDLPPGDPRGVQLLAGHDPALGLAQRAGAEEALVVDGDAGHPVTFVVRP